ncbi:SHNi-TPR domain-containing protein [Aspergillus lucknowensis]|uniref:Tetratricopeptide SHNi-TPR domain-containing protein n=1 Tax=Aspergillus lucknowensis TaxID=176173 RepID=A0ABR4LPK0_9EURO
MDAQELNKASAPSDAAVGDTKEYLGSLVKRAAAKDIVKDYNAAAELYSEATELQAKLNGELSLDNADLLFAYGKALYNVAVSKSDVLGSKIAGKAPTQSETADQVTPLSSAPVPDNFIKNAISSSTAKKEAKAQKSQSEGTDNTPLFQFTGDENFDTDSEGQDQDNADEGEDDEDDDFANAFEVLDLARILYHKKLEAAEEDFGKEKRTDSTPDVENIKEHLADTYDLQAEISLEAEKFADAVTDLRTVLELRQSLLPMEDPSIAECHYKLSLALEFGAVKHDDDPVDDGAKPAKVDEEMRKEAGSQMEKAIESCRVRMSQEQKKLDTDGTLDEDKRTALKRRIANVKEIVLDMEQRLLDLRRPPVSVEREYDEQSESMLKGILGQIIGQSDSEKQSLLDAASRTANDLSAFVKRKPASKPSESSTAPKRAAQEETQEGDSKRSRVDDKVTT